MKALPLHGISRLRSATYFILCNLILGATTPQLGAVTEWTALVYVQAKNNLSPFALKNFSDMAAIGSNETVTTLVQWYQSGQQGVWRYKIEKGKMVLDECNPAPNEGCSATDLTDAMGWAARKYPAQKYSLILWDHGIGILDPAWGKREAWNTKELLELDPDMLSINPRIQIDGITTDTAAAAEFVAAAETSFDHSITSTRGILFNEHSRTYMDNANLSQALSDIKTKVLRGKKIDLLGMDACLMAMVEVGYLAHQSANLMVASQEVELAHGWNYASLMSLLSTKNLSATGLASGIVQSYDLFYKNKVNFYTQSAINLSAMPSVKDTTNAVINAFRACQQYDAAGIRALAKQARHSCLQFSASSYVDLHSFYADFLASLNSAPPQKLKNTQALTMLKNTLTAGMKLIEQSVIANVTGNNTARAKGLSIYFPVTRIDGSYARTSFAQESLWYGFIQELLG